MDEYGEFQTKIAKPLKQGRGKIAMQRLHVILKAVLLRRTKTDMIDGKPLLSLPARNVHLVKIPFADSDELAFYTALKEKAQMQIKCVDASRRADRAANTTSAAI